MDVFGVKKDSSTGVDAVVRAYVNQQAENARKKNDIEIDLLTKIRNYSLKRSAVEHEYGQALQSLRQQYSVDERHYKDLGFTNRSLYGVWNSYLEEIKRLGGQHTSLSQFYAQNIGNNLKNVHASKMDAVKKCTDELKKCTQELVSSAAYTEKYRKSYVEAFSALATAKSKSKSKGLIKTKESTEKMKSKVAELEKSVIDARNLYIIRLEATRTHRNWFAGTLLPKFIQETDGHVYESLWTYLSAATCIEVENYESAGREFKKLSLDMEKMPSSDEHRQQFLSTVQLIPPAQSLEFEPCQSDNVFDIRRSCPNDATLMAEAKTWISSHIRAQKTIDESSYKMAQLEKLARYTDDLKASTNHRSDGGAEITKTLDELRDTIRRAENNKLKADAILNKLTAAGVNVDEMMRATGTDSLSTYSSLGSQRSSSHMSLSTTSDPNSDDTSTCGGQTECIALYSYEPRSQDELRIVQGEVLTTLDNLQDNPWPRAKNRHGQFGLVPCNYIKPIVQDTASSTAKIMRPPLPPKPEKTTLQSAKSASCISREEEEPIRPLFHCRAKYSYPGRDVEELKFNAGDIVAVTDDAPHDVLDGWWKGTVVEGRTSKGISGTFPSMLVEKVSYEELEKSLSSASSFNITLKTTSPTSTRPALSHKTSAVLRPTSANTADRRSRTKTWYGTDTITADHGSESTPGSPTRSLSNTQFLGQFRPPMRPWKSRLQIDDSED